MEDYSGLLKAELITELQKRDQELKEKEDSLIAQVESLEQQIRLKDQEKESRLETLQDKTNQVAQLQSEVGKQSLQVQSLTNTITTLQQKVNTVPNLSKAKDLVHCIVALPKEEKQVLPVITRTTEIGIKAFTVFLHGAATSLNVSIKTQGVQTISEGQTGEQPDETVYEIPKS